MAHIVANGLATTDDPRLSHPRTSPNNSSLVNPPHDTESVSLRSLSYSSSFRGAFLVIPVVSHVDIAFDLTVV